MNILILFKYFLTFIIVELTEALVFLGGEDERVVVRGVEVYNPERYYK